MRSSFGARRHAARRAGAARRVVAGRDFAFGVADVVVVRAERHVGVLQLRIGALRRSPTTFCVSCVRTISYSDVDVERQRHVVEPERRERLPRLGPALQLVVFDRRAAEQKLEKGVLGR